MLTPFKELFLRHKIPAIGCLHVGANTGQEAPIYNMLGFSRVLWIEALPEVFKQLCKNISPYPGHVAFEACVTDKDGELVKFNVTDETNGFQSSSILPLGTHAQEHPTVKYTGQIEMRTTRIDSLLGRNDIKVGPDWFLNVDLQGADLLALKGMGELIRQFKFAYIEVNENPLYVGCALVKEVDDYLAQFKFVGVETFMTRHGWGDRLYRRKD